MTNSEKFSKSISKRKILHKLPIEIVLIIILICGWIFIIISQFLNGFICDVIQITAILCFIIPLIVLNCIQRAKHLFDEDEDDEDEDDEDDEDERKEDDD